MSKKVTKLSDRKKSASTKVGSKKTPPPLPPREALEGMLEGFFGADIFPDEHDPMREAQGIIYDAWEEPSTRRRVSLAKKALKISPDCADAFVILAEETAKSLPEEIALYQQGVEAGERALGKEAMRELRGDFWLALETRPYMRARAGLAQCLWEAGSRAEAVAHYQDMLRLNPNDNQGIRYLVLPHLIEMDCDTDAEKLYRKYRGDGMATWLYLRVLLDFRAHGDSVKTKQSLLTALASNIHIPAFLLGWKRMPRRLPERYSPGDVDEAVLTAFEIERAWQQTQGALQWLAFWIAPLS